MKSSLTFTAKISTDKLDYQTFDAEYAEDIRARVKVSDSDGELEIVEIYDLWNDHTNVQERFDDMGAHNQSVIREEILKQAEKRLGDFT